MTVKAIYENGVFRPQGPVDLDEHTVVEVLIPEKSAHDAAFIVMERLGIREALAVDSDFTHRFIARPGPLRG
jgi:predicted DNA-binding antitoxin AbrB/MazE fold protein